MKKIILSVLIVFFISCAAYSQNQSFNFNGNKIIFGSTTADFLQAYPDYQLIQNENSNDDIKICYRNIEGGNDQSYWFKTNVYFLKDELFMISIDEWFAPENYRDIIRNLLKQFKVTKEESSDEEGGWFHQDLKKGKVKASYDEADAASKFNCYDENIMAKVKELYPGFSY